MTVTIGLPDIDAIDTYGGAFSDDGPVEDPTTDQSAVQNNVVLANVASMTHVLPRAWARFTLGTSGGNPQLASSSTFYQQDAVWGNGLAPTISHTATGTYAVTFPASVIDELGNTHNTNLRWGFATVEGSTCCMAQVTRTGANTFTLYTFNSSGAANDLSGVTVLVTVG